MVASANEKDKAWRWVVVAGGFISNVCVTGFLRSAGVVFFVYFIEEFNITREEAAWPSCIGAISLGLSGLLSGYLTHYFSIRSILIGSALICGVATCLCNLANNMWQINILYGILLGIGMGPITTLTQVITVNYFASQRTTAMGITLAGTSVGNIVGPKLTHWLIDKYGLQGSFLIIGGISLNSLVGISLMKDPVSGGTTPDKVTPTNVECSSKEKPNTDTIESEENASFAGEKKTNQEKEKKPLKEMNWLKDIIRSTIQVFSNFNVCMITLVYVIIVSIYRLYYMITVDLAEERFIPSEKAVFLLSVFAFCDLTGRLTIGLVMDKVGLKLKTIVLLLMGLHGFVVIAITFCNNYNSLMSVFALLGLIYGSTFTHISPLVAEYVDRQNFALAFAISYSVIGFSGSLLPLVVGFFKDRTQSYGLIFVCFGVAQIASIGVWILGSAIRTLVQKKGVPRRDVGKSQDTSP